MKINILDSNFAHHPNNSVAYKQHSKFFEWYRGDELISNTVFFTDLHLKDALRVKRAKRKVAWLLEPRAINPSIYDWIEQNNKTFDYVLTFDKQLLDRGSNFIFYPFGVTWIDNGKKDYSKTKMVSIIGSNKSMTPGHEFRKQIINYCMQRGDVDVYGRGYNEIANKEDGLADYRFSIVMENSQADWYFSEKLIDCFVTQTIPIYWGCDTTRCFSSCGIIKFQTVDDLNNILNSISVEMYKENWNNILVKQDAVFNSSLDVPENWIYNHYPFLFE